MSAEPLLVETVEALFADHCTPERASAAEGSIDGELWELLSSTGLAGVGIAEAVGGAGGSRHDLAATVHAAGYHAAPVPLAEHLIASVTLEAAGVSLPAGPLAIGVAHGRGPVRIHWGPVAATLCLVERDRLSVCPVSDVAPAAVGANYAGEPWLELDPADLAVTAVADVGTRETLLVGALVRSIAAAGAISRAVELSIQHARERQQFGRPIARFQVIQHHLVQMAGEAVVAAAAADEAVETWAAGAALDDVVAAARVAVGRSTALVARLGHQIHGAIGFTDEHRLQLTTRRLWAWRDEWRTDAEWASQLGTATAARGGGRLWAALTDHPGSSDEP